jgi:hypothetical protein
MKLVLVTSQPRFPHPRAFGGIISRDHDGTGKCTSWAMILAVTGLWPDFRVWLCEILIRQCGQ